MAKNLPVNAGDIRDLGSIPGSGKSPGREHNNPLQYSCLENPTDLLGYSPWGRKELDTTEATEHKCSSMYRREIKEAGFEELVLSFSSSALVCPRYHNKIPQAGSLKQRKVKFSYFWSLDVQDKGVNRASFSWGLSPSMTVFSACVHSWCLLFLIRTSVLLERGPTHMTAFNLN